MDKNYLHKVLDQIVSETTIDYRERGKIFTPFLFDFLSIPLLSSHFSSYRSNFTKHCRNIYGLNKEEIEYVWNEYRQIIKDKIKNNG